MSLFSFFVLSGLLFGFFLSAFFALRLITEGSSAQSQKRLSRRFQSVISELEQDGEKKLELLKESYRKELPFIDRMVIKIPRVDFFIDHANYISSVRALRLQILGSLIACPIIGYFAHSAGDSVPLTLTLSLSPLLIPYALIKHKTSKKLMAFESQMPEALDSISRALRAGYTFTDTLRMIAEEFPAPLGTEFQTLFNQINAGIELRTALQALSDRIPSISVMALATTVNLQRETGGNLAETLGKISLIIRKRFNFQRNLKTLTAEGKMSGWVLALLPLVLFCFMYVMDPETAGLLLYDPAGRQLAGIGLILLLLGTLWIRKLTSIDV